MISADTPLIGPAQGSAAQLVAYAKGGNRPLRIAAYAAEVYRVAPLTGLNPLLVCAAACDETALFTNRWWTERLNAGSLGVTGDAAQDEASPTFPDGVAAARGHVAHLLLYATGGIDKGGLTPADDPRYAAYIATHGPVARARTLADLGSAYAANPNYGAQIAGHANAILATKGAAPVAYSFGNVHHPPFQDRLVLDVENGAWNDLGPRDPLGVAQHSEVGTSDGTDAWFRRGVGVSDGLTDYGVKLDGTIYRWNDPRGKAHPDVSPNRAGWASGGSDGLEGDGPAFVRTLGVNAINRDLVSIEREDNGEYSTMPFDGPQFEACAQLTAYWFDQAHVPWDQYPYNPAAGCVTHMLHKEFATKDCPFPPVYDQIDALQNRVRAILKDAQVSVAPIPAPVPVPTPTPVPVPMPTPVPAPVPPPKPVENPGKAWPLGLTTAQLAKRWHKPNRIGTDGNTAPWLFDEADPVCNAWVAECVRLGFTDVKKFPMPVRRLDVEVDPGLIAGTVIFDAAGSKNLMMVRPPVPNGTWRWEK